MPELIFENTMRDGRCEQNPETYFVSELWCSADLNCFLPICTAFRRPTTGFCKDICKPSRAGIAPSRHSSRQLTMAPPAGTLIVIALEPWRQVFGCCKPTGVNIRTHAQLGCWQCAAQSQRSTQTTMVELS